MKETKEWKLWTGGILIGAYCLRYAPLIDRMAGTAYAGQYKIMMSLDALVTNCNGSFRGAMPDCGNIMFLNFLSYLVIGIGVLMILHFYFGKKRG